MFPTPYGRFVPESEGLYSLFGTVVVPGNGLVIQRLEFSSPLVVTIPATFFPVQIILGAADAPPAEEPLMVSRPLDFRATGQAALLVGGATGLTHVVRRVFVFAAATACRNVLAQPGERAPVRIRHSHETAEGKKALVDYAAAVKAMKELPATDRRNWKSQAQIHADRCPHGNWFFLPWHRAYIDYFEQACASVLSKPAFALPYMELVGDACDSGPVLRRGQRTLPRRAGPQERRKVRAKVGRRSNDRVDPTHPEYRGLR